MKFEVKRHMARGICAVCAKEEYMQKIEGNNTCFLSKENDCTEKSMKNYKNGKKSFEEVQNIIYDMIVSANSELVAKGQAVVTGGMLFPKEAIEGETAKTQSKLSAE